MSKCIHCGKDYGYQKFCDHYQSGTPTIMNPFVTNMPGMNELSKYSRESNLETLESNIQDSSKIKRITSNQFVIPNKPAVSRTNNINQIINRIKNTNLHKKSVIKNNSSKVLPIKSKEHLFDNLFVIEKKIYIIVIIITIFTILLIIEILFSKKMY
jgi:hypothetical protein